MLVFIFRFDHSLLLRCQPFNVGMNGFLLAPLSLLWEIPTMKTLKVDARSRVRLPDLRPGQVVGYEKKGDGTFSLHIIREVAEEDFPRGSLLKYVTKKRNKEQLALLKGCSLDVE